MRVYLSKLEAYSIQYLLMNEIQRLSDLPINSIKNSRMYEKIRMLDRINCRIEDCLMLQKSGYNRKENYNDKN